MEQIKEAEFPPSTLPPEVLNNPRVGIEIFFSGNSLEEVKSDIEKLKETTITESYGDLDKEDKWNTMEMFRRLSFLVDVANFIRNQPASSP